MLVSSIGQLWRSQHLFSKAAFNAVLGLSLFAGVAVNASATSCEQLNSASISSSNIRPQHLSATYSVTTSQGEQKRFTLLRNAEQVIYQHNDVSFELWNKQGEYVRYFPKQQRSISYRKGDLLSLNMQFDYQQLSQLIAPKTLQQLTLVSAQQATQQETGAIDLTCLQAKHYRNEQHQHQQLQLTWLPELALPATMTMVQDGQQLKFQLVALTPLSSTQFAEHTANYRDMDFADVGDNESDPFIAQMIHQGFIQHGSSGFYDSQGNALSTGAAGHQH
ncbi:hypothetical protein [Shewanella fidelis]|uniref:hypothetical protein n=1 Tax=Shewanella fidelis TaxID=173509 RepID=UPI0004B37D17|nr:hypothetical protein [Shewanella fidelis]